MTGMDKRGVEGGWDWGREGLRDGGGRGGGGEGVEEGREIARREWGTEGGMKGGGKESAIGEPLHQSHPTDYTDTEWGNTFPAPTANFPHQLEAPIHTGRKGKRWDDRGEWWDDQLTVCPTLGPQPETRQFFYYVSDDMIVSHIKVSRCL